MLNSFQIKNFRIFQHIEVERLKRVNLLVGKNNSGKSTFLEAVELYASNASPAVILDLVESRQETWFSEAQPQLHNSAGNFIRHLFFQHQLPEIGERGISLGEISTGAEIHVGTAAYQDKSDEEGTVRRVKVSKSQLDLFGRDLLFDEDLSNTEIFLVAEESEKTRILFRLEQGLRNIHQIGNRLFYGSREPDLKFTYQTVSTGNMSSKKLAALWDLTSLTNLESDVISALQLIDSRVTGIAFVEDSSQNSGRMHSGDNRIPLVKFKGVDEPLPLKSMGDGMTRLFHIIVALVNARSGLLLIDEFENGLHWSVQPKVWDIIFQLSQKLDIQVFATTHSRDCVEGFDSAWNKHPALGAFFRLDDKGGTIRVTEYTSETLTDAIEMDVEVR